MKQKLFSVIIPTYNCGRKLAATLESVLSQPRGLYEIVVVDGGSEDETLGIIGEYAGEITSISEADQGVYDALNKGVRMSSGKYIIFLGAGDRLREGVLTRVAEVLPEGEPAFVYGDALLVRPGVVHGGAFVKKNFTGVNICHQAIFYERNIFALLGGFDLRYKVYADWAFNMKCFAEPRVRKIYTGLLISDFEGWGISDTQKDHEFEQDLPRLIREFLGVGPYLRHRIYLARVSFYVFRRKCAGSARAAAAALSASRLSRRTSGVGGSGATSTRWVASDLSGSDEAGGA